MAQHDNGATVSTISSKDRSRLQEQFQLYFQQAESVKQEYAAVYNEMVQQIRLIVLIET